MEAKLARSKSGHDKGRYYVITGGDEGYVYLADGSSRTLERPKKKNRKHIQVILNIPPDVEDLLCRDEPPGDLELKRALKLYVKGL